MIYYYTMEQIEAFRRTGYIVRIVGCDESNTSRPHLFACQIEELLPPTPTPTPAPPPDELDQLIALMPPIPDPNSNPEV